MGTVAKGEKVGLNKELLIWCGFTQHGRIWTYPDGVDVDNGVPCFLESLDEIFKWLVPRLSYWTISQEVNTRAGASVQDFNHKRSGVVFGETPALAFCLAIQKLIRSEQC